MKEQNRPAGSFLSTVIMMLAMTLLPLFANAMVMGSIFCIFGIVSLIAWAKTSKSPEPKEASRRKVLGYTTCILLVFGLGCIYFGIAEMR